MTSTTPCVWAVRDSPLGPLLLAATEAGLVTVGFHADAAGTRRYLARLAAGLGGEPVPAGSPAPGGGGGGPAGVLARAEGELAAYFRGELRRFTVPLDWSLTSGFTERVLRRLAASVPYGRVVGYRQLGAGVPLGPGGETAGDPGAARAVGAAMGANPLPIVVPCHRVVAADGGIGGFGGGLETKRALLALEGVLPAPLF